MKIIQKFIAPDFDGNPKDKVVIVMKIDYDEETDHRFPRLSEGFIYLSYEDTGDLARFRFSGDATIGMAIGRAYDWLIKNKIEL